MPDPITFATAGSLLSGLNASVTFSKFVYELKNTPIDVKTCLDLVARVDEDIQFAISLRAKHLKQFEGTPETLRRLDRIVADATESILNVGRLLEGCRREAHGGKVPMRGRVKWILSDSMAFSRRTANLQQQHAAINGEIAFMRQFEAPQPLRDLTVSTTFENAELFSMGRRRSLSRRSSLSGGARSPPPKYSSPVPRRSAISDETPAYQAAPGTGVGINGSMTASRSCTPSTWESGFGPQQPMTPIDNPFCQIAELDTGQCGDIPVTPPRSMISKYWEPGQGMELDTRQSSLMYQAAPGISQCQDSSIMSPQTAAPSIRQSYQRMDQVNRRESLAYQAPTPTSPTMRLPTILRPGMPGSWQPVCGTQQEARREEAPRGDDFEEEEDPEVAFYKDLRQQEEERQHRRAVSRNDNNSFGRNSWA